MRSPVLAFLLVLLFSQNAGAQWIEVFSGFSVEDRGLQKIAIVDRNVVWAVAWDGRINPVSIQEYTKSVDGGVTWVTGTINGANPTYEAACITAVSEDSAWVAMFDSVNSGGAILRTTDGGQTWMHQTTAEFKAPYGGPNVVHFFDARNGFAMGDPNGEDTGAHYFEIYTTTDGGNNWIRVPANKVAPSGYYEFGMIGNYEVWQDHIWFGTTYGRVYHSRDRGYSWDVFNTPLDTTSPIVSLAFRDSLNGLAVGRATTDPHSADMGVLKTTDGGKTWTVVATGVTGGIEKKNDIAFVPMTDDTYIITGSSPGSEGSAFSTDGGQTWTQIDTVKHYKLEFQDFDVAYSGSFQMNGNSGVFKWTGGLFPIGIASTPEAVFSIYPNPGDGNLFIRTNTSSPMQFSAFDAMGRQVYAGVTTGELTHLDLSGSDAGVYLLRFNTGRDVYTRKVIIR
ncbi:MAG: T9SS type A sorting domain-containing protein [Bacteroidota bacterium]|nr:T9SS type A sorting domain-containing protein [Bacteroidota bacterium]